MCGISGFLQNSGKYTVSMLKSMTDAIRHRGPDDEGYAIWDRLDQPARLLAGDESSPGILSKLPHVSKFLGERPSVALAHRRFSIIAPDLSGHQPFVDDETGNVMVFNGEIYNYLEIRKELQNGYGIRFKTSTDSEVLLLSYRVWGEECFSKFNGFWAVAIFDKNRRKLLLSRDRFGKKPLYYCQNQNGLSFASEIRALSTLFRNGRQDLKLNDSAAFLYLVYDRRNTLYGSMWENIHEVPAAGTLTYDFSSQEISRSKYWEFPEERNSKLSFPEATEQLKEIFKRAVSIRLRADVPYSANLSGGMDSSAIVAVAQEILGKKKLKTNYIGYPNAKELDESYYANSVAKFTNCDHQHITIQESDVWQNLEYLIDAFEEPVHSQAFMSQWLGWKAISETGCKVILHGAAGDELMAGYQYYPYLNGLNLLNSGRLIQYHRHFPLSSMKNIGRPLKWAMEGQVLPFITNPVRKMLGATDRRKWMREYVPEDQRKCFNSSFLEENMETNRVFNKLFMAANASPASRMKEDFKQLRIPFWVNAMDKSMMSIPVEVRMPFLDYELVEFMFSLPIEYHLKGEWTKYILRKSLEDKLPKEVLWRRDKMGFTVPKESWMRSRKGDVIDCICDSKADVGNYINIKELKRNWDQVSVDYRWRILNFTMWKKMFNLS